MLAYRCNLIIKKLGFIYANHIYKILTIEMERTGAGARGIGPAATRLLDIGDPKTDWVSVARGFGLHAVRCETAEAFDHEFGAAMARRGPTFIEAAI